MRNWLTRRGKMQDGEFICVDACDTDHSTLFVGSTLINEFLPELSQRGKFAAERAPNPRWLSNSAENCLDIMTTITLQNQSLSDDECLAILGEGYSLCLLLVSSKCANKDWRDFGSHTARMTRETEIIQQTPIKLPKSCTDATWEAVSVTEAAPEECVSVVSLRKKLFPGIHLMAGDRCHLKLVCVSRFLMIS